MTSVRTALIFLFFATTAQAEPTVVEDPPAMDRLMGEHVFNLQWIDNPPGRAVVEDKGGGELHLSAEQRNKKGDFATIKGKVLKVTAKTFTIDGEIITRVHHMAGGKPCVRAGIWTFRITGSRKYWRLKEMENPCEGANTVDYLDVYFERPKR